MNACSCDASGRGPIMDSLDRHREMETRPVGAIVFVAALVCRRLALAVAAAAPGLALVQFLLHTCASTQPHRDQRGLNAGLYVDVSMTQLATSAGCARYPEIGPRFARWLLMSQDGHTAALSI